jgi:hypothetical protein
LVIEVSPSSVAASPLPASAILRNWYMGASR